MSQATENHIGSYEAAADLEEFRGVKLDANGKINYPTAVSDRIIGVTQERVLTGKTGAVKYLSAPGTQKVQLGNDAITMAAGGVPLFLAAANGLFVDTDPGSGVVWFIGIETVSANGVAEAYPAKLS